jgi:hypothetical protein
MRHKGPRHRQIALLSSSLSPDMAYGCWLAFEDSGCLRLRA